MKPHPNYKIFGELDNLKSSFENDQIQIIENLYFHQWNIIRMCEFYSNSKYLSGNVDTMGRDKPFYNIVNYRVSLAKTATDLEIKDIQVQSDNPKHYTTSMFLNRESQKWMKDKDVQFEKVLNKMNITRPKYGGYIAKRSWVDKKLKIDVPEWKNIMNDQVEVLGGPLIETHYMSPVEISKKKNVWYNVTAVLKAFKKTQIGNQGKKIPMGKITVYELQGEFPDAVYLDAEEENASITDGDWYKYSLQKYFIAVVGDTKFLMYCEDLSSKKITDTYRYLPWEEMPGRGLGKGVIEDSEEAQVWTNDSISNEKSAMDLAGKVAIKTTSKKLANNILEVDNGKIFQLDKDTDMGSINFSPGALGEFQSQIDRWKSQADDVTSSYDAATGAQPPSGTPYSQTALLNNVAMKPLEYKRGEWGTHLSLIWEEWVIPYLIDQLYDSHILRSDFTDAELAQIDRDFATFKMNDITHDAVLNGEMPIQADFENGVQQIMGGLKKGGKSRYIKFPKGYFDDWEGNCTVVTSGDDKNKAATLQSLSTILSTVIQSYNPNTGKFGVLEDPILSDIFGRIVEIAGAGISPISLGIGAPAQATPVAPAQGNFGTPLATATQPALSTSGVALSK